MVDTVVDMVVEDDSSQIAASRRSAKIKCGSDRRYVRR
jgi:hypothetical protein